MSEAERDLLITVANSLSLLLAAAGIHFPEGSMTGYDFRTPAAIIQDKVAQVRKEAGEPNRG